MCLESNCALKHSKNFSEDGKKKLFLLLCSDCNGKVHRSGLREREEGREGGRGGGEGQKKRGGEREGRGKEKKKKERERVICRGIGMTRNKFKNISLFRVHNVNHKLVKIMTLIRE